MEREPQTYAELKAKYLAVKRRLGGVVGPTGVVPPERVSRAVSVASRGTPVLEVRIPNKKFVAMLKEIAEMHGVNPNLIRSPTIRHDVVKVRRELFYRAKNELHLGCSEIGRLMGVTHSTVIHGLKKYEEGLRTAQNLVSS